MAEGVGIPRETLSKRVYGWIRGEILAGRLTQGDRLSEVSIAEQLGVSPTPVREAVRLLSGAGLVEYHDHRGVRVAQFSEEEIAQCFSTRLALERLALREACPRMSSGDKKRLLRLAEANAAAADEPAATVFELDRRFHEFYVTRSGNRWLIDFLQQLSDALTVARLPLYLAADTPKTTAEHVEIARHISENDVDGADLALEAHIQRVGAQAVAAHRRIAVRPEREGAT